MSNLCPDRLKIERKNNKSQKSANKHKIKISYSYVNANVILAEKRRLKRSKIQLKNVFSVRTPVIIHAKTFWFKINNTKPK